MDLFLRANDRLIIEVSNDDQWEDITLITLPLRRVLAQFIVLLLLS